MRNRILLLCGCLWLSIGLTGQSVDSSFLRAPDLPVIEFSVERQWQPPAVIQRWDSIALKQRQIVALSDLLGQESGVFIKSYGLGSLATSSFRGAGAGQITVLWNGLPLENPMLGLLDLSQLNTAFFQQVTVAQGGQSGGYGSRAIAGSIQLSSGEKVDHSGFSLGVDAGALGLQAFNGHGYFVSPNRKWSFRTDLSVLTADNDFQYFDPRANKKVRQSHARQQQHGFQQTIFFQPNADENWSLRIWGQTYEKEIPAAAAQRNAESSQGDDFLRTSLHYDRRKGHKHLQIRSGLFRETIDFRDPPSDIHAISHFWKALLEGEHSWHLPHDYKITTGVSNQWVEAEVAAYGQLQAQLRVAPFVLIGQQKRNWNWQISGRQEVVDGKLSAFSPAVYLAWKPVLKVNLTARLSRNFRLPSLNDLHWIPGGNPDLLPESGWAEEVSAAYQITPSLQLDFTAYHRLLNNWIQWAPAANGGNWSARNLTKVRSYGGQFRLRSSHQLSKLAFATSWSANYVQSLNLIAIDLPRLEANEQLAYTPEWTANTHWTLRGKFWSLAYNQQYVGTRRGNNSETLDAYWPARLTADYVLKIRQGQLKFGLRIENIWNHEYRVLERYRMPGRYLQGRLVYSWQQQKNNSFQAFD